MADRRLAGAALAAVTLLLVLAPAAPVDAHATAVAAWPAPGQVLAAAPDRITIEFSNDVEAQVDVAVVDPSGESVMVGDPVVEGRYVTQELRATDAVGGYVAAFHAVAVDLHPVIARVPFTVDPDATATANPAGDAPELAAVSADPAPADQGKSQLPALLLLLGVGVLVGVTVLHLVGRRTLSARR